MFLPAFLNIFLGLHCFLALALEMPYDKISLGIEEKEREKRERTLFNRPFLCARHDVNSFPCFLTQQFRLDPSSHSGYMTLGKLLNLSRPQLPLLENRNNNAFCFIELLEK